MDVFTLYEVHVNEDESLADVLQQGCVIVPFLNGLISKNISALVDA